MKVLYIAHSVGLQGAGFALINIIKAIKNKGITPILLLPSYGPIAIEAEKVGVKCYYHPCRNSVYPSLTSFIDIVLFLFRLLRICAINYFAKKYLEKIIKIEKPDIIHTNTGVIRFGALVAKKHNIPHVWHIREYQTLDFAWKPIGGIEKQRNLYKDSNNHCIAITHDVFNYFELNKKKDITIYDGVFSSSIELPISVKQDYFLFVGCLKEGKGVLDVINAFELIADKLSPNTELWLVGDDEINIHHRIFNSKYPGLIKYLGFRKDVYQLMANAIALIVPSKFEGFGFITTEAMLNRCLVIGRNTGGTKEQFDNGKAFTGEDIGLRFTTLEELSIHMKNVRFCYNDYLDMVERGYKTVTTFYTIENNINHISRIYNTLNK